jgi:hypothetical protein
VEERTQNKKDWSLEILTPAQMETFLKDFNSEAIQYYEYLNDMESTINKQKDILIKSQELDKDFTNRKSNLNKSAQNLDGGRSSEIEKVEAELNAEVSKADIIRTAINDKLSEVENGVASIETVSVEVIEKSSFKSYTDKYNRLRSEITKMQESVLTRDVKKENQTILDESKKAAEMDGGTAVEPTTGHFFDAKQGTYNATYSNTNGDSRAWTDLSPILTGYLVFEDYQIRPNTAKPGTFEFRQPNWEAYGIQEWITVEGFGEGTEMQFDINIGKAVESFTVTFVSVDVPGDGQIHPILQYKYWAVPMELANEVENSGTALDFAQLLIDESYSGFENVDGVLTANKVNGKQTLTWDGKAGYWVDSEFGNSVEDFSVFGGAMSWVGENGFKNEAVYRVNSEGGIVWYGTSGEFHNFLEEEYMKGETGGGEEPVGDHIKSTGSYELSSTSLKGLIDGTVTSGKRGNELTFNDGITHIQVVPEEEAGTFAITQVGSALEGGWATMIASGVSFLTNRDETATLSFTQASPKEGGMDIEWTISYTPSGEKPGDGLTSNHPLEDYVYLYDYSGSIDSTIASFQSFKSEGGIYMERNPQLDGAVTSQPDSKGGYYKLVNDGAWRVNNVHPELGEGMSSQSSSKDFEQFISPEFTLFMGNVYKITLSSAEIDSPYFMGDRYVYAVSSTWYNSLEGGSGEDGGDELGNHIRTSGTYGLQQQGSLAKFEGEVAETLKLGTVLTFTSGLATSYQIRTGVEGLDVVKVTVNQDKTTNEFVLIQGTAFLEGPAGEMLTFSEPSEKEGGEDIQWTVTWESGLSNDEDGENTVTHIVDGGTYTHTARTGKVFSMAVTALAANDGLQTTLKIANWKISPDPMSKSSDTFIAQEVIVDEETGKESYGVGIQIGQFSSDSISWTIAAAKEGEESLSGEDTVHTVTYQIPKTR